RSQAEVLICGEPGSGTSKLADAIHQLSGDASRPFVKLSAAGLTRSGLAEGFGAARGGTLFLDEVASLDPAVQFALLEHLDHPAGARVVAGTYRQLEDEAEAGRFNADLFYRLDIIRIRIPALRERPEDIPVLFRHYVALACEQAGLAAPEITPELTADLMAREWPGNARALMNTAMRFAMGLERETKQDDTLGLTERLAQVERSLLIEALEKHHGRATQAAQALKLPRKTFYDKLSRYGLRAEDYRN
ncbi:MAG TPA: sigma-54-dependent Fis family transcriptional regulator, partial [Aliiroseovarius sp.]|nr:sigma-54-dependent Fis family transcriptional regulator [Aliiroseovarius sp.]